MLTRNTVRQALNRAVGALQHEGADLLSVLPQEIVVTWAENWWYR